MKECSLARSSPKSNIVVNSSKTNWQSFDRHSSSGQRNPMFSFLIKERLFHYLIESSSHSFLKNFLYSIVLSCFIEQSLGFMRSSRASKNFFKSG